MFSRLLGWIHFWGWQGIIVSAALTLPLGFTTSKEYAELEWPIDIAITLVWVVFAINMFGTLIKRRERHMYVAIWFYIATVVTVAVLHIGNSIELPVSLAQELPRLCRRAGCPGPVVVRAQRRGVLPHDAVPGADVLLPPEGRGPAGLLVPALDHPLLVADLHLYLGRSASPALHGPAGLGAVARDRVLGDAARTVVGRHDQRAADAARCMGQSARRSGAEVHGRRGHRVRHGDIRRADAVAQERERHHALHRLDHLARPRRRPGLERIPDVRNALLAGAEALRDHAAIPASWRTSTSGSGRSASCSTPWPCTPAASRSR